MAKLFNFDELIKSGVNQAMKECELTIGMTLKEAVEKQIPKKVKVEKRPEYLSVLVCPICSKSSLVGMSYCRFCGQRLDWSDT